MPDPLSQSVLGSAPINRNRWLTGRRISSASRAKSPAYRLQHAVTAFQAADGGARYHLNVGKGVDAVDQIARHRLREICTTHEHPDFDALAR